MKVRLDQIKVGERTREDMGDIDGLAASMRDRGLLHPVVLAPDMTLVAGARRLEGARRLGWDSIEATMIASLAELKEQLFAERDENTCRKQLTPSEMVAMGEKVRALALPGVQAAHAAAKKAGAPKGGRGRKKEIPNGSRDPLGISAKKPAKNKEDGRLRKIIGESVGSSGRTYERAKAVVESAREDPEMFGDIVEEMDRTGKVRPAHEKLQERQNGMPQPDSGFGTLAQRESALTLANTAIDALKKIGRKNPARAETFQKMAKWIKKNQ